MDPENKPRADSKLDSMPGNQVMELRDKLMAGTSYKECLAWLDLECGVESSLASLSTFYKRHCWPLVKERRQISVIRAEALGDAMKLDPVNWDEVIIEKTKQLAFEYLATDPNDPDAVAKLLDAIVKARKQTFTEQHETGKSNREERKLKLMEKKARRMDELETKAKEIVAGGGLSPETLEVIEKQLKLL